ncbi:ogr/Delta-like zinc finger family protein [Enterobacter sp.]|uniref:ogr/Delta-like zinc finger family protein n=1 Tax=Enterobacter sp. TaxID=42895 RepID=UPI00296E997A|nr:ogr/Delta-like zinc finger family protein [Enterobacter sp.]
MINCPECGGAAHTRSSFQVSTTTTERYLQCQNVECSHTFVTHETYVRSIIRPEKVSTAPPHPAKGGQSHMNF